MILAKWESKSGKHWVTLIRSEWGVSYSAPQAHGTFANPITDEEAIADIEKQVSLGYFQPDANKTPMKRVA
jgi:hypothetical protein